MLKDRYGTNRPRRGQGGRTFTYGVLCVCAIVAVAFVRLPDDSLNSMNNASPLNPTEAVALAYPSGRTEEARLLTNDGADGAPHPTDAGRMRAEDQPSNKLIMPALTTTSAALHGAVGSSAVTAEHAPTGDINSGLNNNAVNVHSNADGASSAGGREHGVCKDTAVCKLDWLLCCPGERGSKFCSAQDCDPARPPSEPCQGNFMRQQCAESCHVCVNPTVHDQRAKERQMVVDGTPDNLSKQLTAQVAAILPHVLHRTTTTGSKGDTLSPEDASSNDPGTPMHDLSNALSNDEQQITSQQQQQHSHDVDVLIFVTVSLGYLEFFFNWYQSARKVGIEQFVVLAEDVKVYESIL